MSPEICTISGASLQKSNQRAAEAGEGHPADQALAISTGEVETEETRLRQAYARRKQTVPGGRYSYFNYGNLLIEQEIDRHFLQTLHRVGRSPLSDKKILDVGCGTGSWLHKLIRWGAQPGNLFGVDLFEERISEAKQLLPSEISLKVGNASNLQFADRTFDLIFQFTVFSSILDSAVRRQVANEMLRVLKPGGCIVWHDLLVDNPFNKDVHGLNKRAIRELFPDCKIQARRITLAPPIARALGPWSPVLCRMLSSLKLFSTHYLVFITRVAPA